VEWWCRQIKTPGSSTRALWQFYKQSHLVASRRNRGRLRIWPSKIFFVPTCKWSWTCHKMSRHGASGFTSPKEDVLRVITLNNPSPRPGFNPRTLDPVTSTLTVTPQRRRLIREISHDNRFFCPHSFPLCIISMSCWCYQRSVHLLQQRWKQLEVFSHTLLMFEVYGTRVLIIMIKEGYGLVREANEAADLSFPHCGGWVVHALLMFFTPPPSNPVFQSLVINGLYIICFGFISGQLVPTPFSSTNLTPTTQRAIFCCSGVHWI
jgi:hypothetical protein